MVFRTFLESFLKIAATEEKRTVAEKKVFCLNLKLAM